MRSLALVLLLASPAAAWEFSPTPVCTLSQTEVAPEVIVTHDPAAGLYAISVTHVTTWTPGAVFSIEFLGTTRFTISTTRHTLSDDNRTVTVTGTGFGNVLNGLAGEGWAAASIDNEGVMIPLDGIAEPLERFLNCDAVLSG